MAGKGLTLIETLVATGLLFISAIVILSMLASSNTAIANSGNTYLATQIAQDELEDWQRQGYTWIVAEPSPVTGSTSVAGNANGTTRTTNFSWTVTHSHVVAGHVEQVIATVSWTQKGGASYTNSVQLVTEVAQ